MEIGQLTALLMLTKVMAPYLWGAVADRRQQRLVLVRMGGLLTFVSYLGFFWVESFWGYAAIIVCFSFFWNAILPQYEVLTLHNLGVARDRYSRIRLWGSLGFILAVSLLGYLFDLFGIIYFPYALLFIVACIFVTTLPRLKEPNVSNHSHEQSRGLLFELGRHRTYMFFVVCFLLQASHGAYYTYYSLYLESIGYKKDVIGLLWALGVLAEVLLFIVMHAWQARHSLRTIIQVALFLSAVRWLMIGSLSDSWSFLLIAQCLHAFSFGAMHAAAIHFVHRRFSLPNQGRAQAIYSSMGFGAGGVVGAIVSASIVTSVGFHHAFNISAIIAVIALLGSFLIGPSGRRHNDWLS